MNHVFSIRGREIFIGFSVSFSFLLSLCVFLFILLYFSFFSYYIFSFFICFPFQVLNFLFFHFKY